MHKEEGAKANPRITSCFLYFIYFLVTIQQIKTNHTKIKRTFTNTCTTFMICLQHIFDTNLHDIITIRYSFTAINVKPLR